jgi:hypothetical protein
VADAKVSAPKRSFLSLCALPVLHWILQYVSVLRLKEKKISVIFQSLKRMAAEDLCVCRLTPRATWAWSLVVRGAGTRAGAWYLVPRPFWPAGLCTTCPTCPANMSTHCSSAIRQANYRVYLLAAQVDGSGTNKPDVVLFYSLIK